MSTGFISDSGRPTYLMCPNCYRRGVHIRLANNGEDHYRCRYSGCYFYAFTSGTDTTDVVNRERLANVNPGYEVT